MLRPKTLSRTSPTFSGYRSEFDRMCAESGLTNGQIARSMGKDESFVRKLRDGRHLPNIEHVRLLPPTLKDAVLSYIRRGA